MSKMVVSTLLTFIVTQTCFRLRPTFKRVVLVGCCLPSLEVVVLVIEPLGLDIRVSSVNLQLKVTFALRSGVARTTYDGEGVWIADLLVELDLLTEDLQVRDSCLRHKRALARELCHKLALKTSDHPANKVLALEGAGNIAVLLSHRDVGRTRMSQSQLELGYLSELLGREAG